MATDWINPFTPTEKAQLQFYSSGNDSDIFNILSFGFLYFNLILNGGKMKINITKEKKKDLKCLKIYVYRNKI